MKYREYSQLSKTISLWTLQERWTKRDLAPAQLATSAQGSLPALDSGLNSDSTRLSRKEDLRVFRVSVLAGSEFDAIFHFGPGNEEIRKVQKERGLRGAIQWYEEK